MSVIRGAPLTGEAASGVFLIWVDEGWWLVDRSKLSIFVTDSALSDFDNPYYHGMLGLHLGLAYNTGRQSAPRRYQL